MNSFTGSERSRPARDTGGASKFVATAAVAGAATMVVELGAVRLLAPSFGASTTVWTGVIGAILLALALGYALGARLASSALFVRATVVVLSGAAALIAWLPMLARALGDPFDSNEAGATTTQWGSALAALILLAPPAALLGCVGPLCVEGLAQSRGESAGRAGGAVFAAGTLGSLAGTLLATHWLLPRWGLEWSFLAVAAGLCTQAAALALSCEPPAPIADAPR